MPRYKYSSEDLRAAVIASISYAGVLRELGIPQTGGSQTYMKSRIEREGIDTSHFTGQGWNKNGRSVNRLTAEEILVVRSPLDHKLDTYRLRRSLLEIGREHVCVECGLADEWNGKKIVLEIDHINGEWWDNTPGNLRFLCPNCHSQQTETNKSWKRTEKSVVG